MFVRGQMLNHLTNVLFDLLVSYKSAKEILNTLEKKYDFGKTKSVVGKLIEASNGLRKNLLWRMFTSTESSYLRRHRRHENV